MIYSIRNVAYPDSVLGWDENKGQFALRLVPNVDTKWVVDGETRVL